MRTGSAVQAKARYKPSAPRRLKGWTEVLFDPEVVVLIAVAFRVLSNHLVCDITRAVCEITSRPHPLAPVPFPQRRELSLQLV